MLMDWTIFGVVSLWLAIVSWFDLRKGEVPHSAWIMVPLLAAGTYRAWLGGWQLVVLAALVTLVSERQRFAQLVRFQEAGRMLTWLPLLFLALFWAIQIYPLTAFSIVGFWIAWELGWWGGADGVSAITLSLVWPGTQFFLAFFGCHSMIALGMMAFSYKAEKKVKLHRVPGLPIMLLTVFFSRIFLNV
jgi:hypothetical protein